MRVDYFHSGGTGGEAARLDAVLVEGPWPGSRTQLVDTTNLGNYFFEVLDLKSQRVLYSRGFASIYGEWETRSGVPHDEPDVSRIVAVSLAVRARPHHAQEARPAECVSAASG